MKCTKCGGELPEGSKFCFFCGAAQTAPEKIKCAKCGGELPDGSKFCYFCGAAQSPSPAARRKNRTTYQLLAFFLGGLGVHSFYAGYTGKGIVQLLLCCTGVSSIWALIDIFTVTKDADGVPMATAAPAPPEPRKDAAPARPEVEKIPEAPVRSEVPAQDPGEKPPKSRFVYQVLAVFLGSLGIHNFYAGRTGIAITQLLISCTGASSIWALIEILAVKKDGSGRPMTVGGQNPKSRNKYRYLALFLGAFGIHDFYAGRIVPGFIHLVISCTGIGFVVSAVWAFVEIFAVKTDSAGVVMPLKKDRVCGIVSAGCALLCLILVACMGLGGGIFRLTYPVLYVSAAASLLSGFAALLGGNWLMPLVSLLLLVSGCGLRHYVIMRMNRRWIEQEKRSCEERKRIDTVECGRKAMEKHEREERERKALEERRRREEEERERRELEERKRREREERERRELEERKRREEERKQKELEEREREERERRELEERKARERERQRQILEERKRKKEERRRQVLEERERRERERRERKALEERKRREREERERRELEERKRREEEERRQKEIEERKRREEEERRQKEIEARKRREEEERRQKEIEERKRREEEERKQKELEERKRREFERMTPFQRATAKDRERGIVFDDSKQSLVRYNRELADDHYEVPEGVVAIEMDAFANCGGLKSVTIPGSVKDIGQFAFRKCLDLTVVKIHDGVTTIGKCAFKECKDLKDVAIPGSVKNIGDSAFEGCGLVSLRLPKGVTTIGKSAFKGCHKLESVTIPGSVKNIGEGAFFRCTSLESVAIQEGVRTIGVAAFYHCRSLGSVTIPGSVTSIGQFAFRGCPCEMQVSRDNPHLYDR